MAAARAARAAPLVRDERAGDADAIREILLAAFGREAEARLVDRLNASGKVVRSLVAEEEGRILGHVLFSQIEIGQARLPALSLAPLAVMPAFQRLGIGSALVSAGLQRLRVAGHARVVVVGEPAYYPRFGFVPASRFGLRCPFPAPEEAFMAIALARDAFRDAAGMVAYGPEFDDLE
ncbi:MAG TPA: N-acetyltransferase [Burkholderiales bacterium]|jgi:putative acetyltransferase|nr:N-acetyltransferase [Burkholderiales bacterium]